MKGDRRKCQYTKKQKEYGKFDGESKDGIEAFWYMGHTS
jgi:hypothetical protein